MIGKRKITKRNITTKLILYDTSKHNVTTVYHQSYIIKLIQATAQSY